jgi:hypothetical protein
MGEIQQTYSLYLLQMVWVEQLFLDNQPHYHVRMFGSFNSMNAGTAILLYMFQNVFFHINVREILHLPRSTSLPYS